MIRNTTPPPELLELRSGLTLAAKVGQLLFPSIDGTLDPDGDTTRAMCSALAGLPYGGFIVFQGAMSSTPVLLERLQAASSLPLLVASDIEAGVGLQITGTTTFPPFLAIGATRSADHAYAVGRATAREARAVGINWAFAPVADVNTVPGNPIINSRSCGDDPRLVSELAAAFVRGCQDHGLLATAKHFPGHGGTDRDSHSELPVVPADRQTLEIVHLDPFRRCIAAGVAAIMTAHIRVPALQGGEAAPATLSPAIMDQLLRKQMGFPGLIVTDALNMDGIGKGNEGETALAALQAGCDVLLMPRHPRRLYRDLLEAVHRGRLSEERLNVSVDRILAAKDRIGLLGGSGGREEARLSYAPRPTPHALTAAERREFADRARAIAEESLTLIRDRDKRIPLPPSVRAHPRLLIVDDDGREGIADAWIAEAHRRFPGRAVTVVRGRDDAALLTGMEADSTDTITVGALYSSVRAWKGRAGLDPELLAVLNQKAARGWPLVLTLFGSPYDADSLPAVGSLLCAYGAHEESQRASWRALFGEIPCAGRLPVGLRTED